MQLSLSSLLAFLFLLISFFSFLIGFSHALPFSFLFSSVSCLKFTASLPSLLKHLTPVCYILRFFLSSEQMPACADIIPQKIALLIAMTEKLFVCLFSFCFCFLFCPFCIGLIILGELSKVTEVIGRIVQKGVLNDPFEAYNKIWDVYWQLPRFCKYQHFSWSLIIVNYQNKKTTYHILLM